jgi:hypothetical protein
LLPIFWSTDQKQNPPTPLLFILRRHRLGHLSTYRLNNCLHNSPWLLATEKGLHGLQPKIRFVTIIRESL